MASYRQASQLSGVMSIREDARRTIAYLVVACYFALLATIVLIGWMVLRLNTEDMLKVLTTTAGVVGGIVGAVVGFYFQARA